ncbi:hypothetical protein niasHS_004495 [Heterodera schachtii]|uniref:MATH domain-containing protein n=1 Tax=Heterodera schachtii TaxID=97005 RepID=A0ABD2JMR5_HETSC
MWMRCLVDELPVDDLPLRPLNNKSTGWGFENFISFAVPDVEAVAFKVMLSFIYTDDLSGLNGDNSMAMLYAAKKYNIPALVTATLQIPFSEMRNIFLAYAQALLFDLEGFANDCLAYIDKNADTLFKTNEFLQIDQKLLFGILAQEEFTKDIVPSGVLTKDEVIDVLQYNCHNRISVQFPSDVRILTERTILMDIETVSEYVRAEIISSAFSSLTVQIKRLPWKIWAQIKRKSESSDKNEKWLGIYLLCDASEEDPSWSCKCSATFRIISQKNVAENSIGTLCDHVFDNKSKYLGFENFISYAALLEPSNGFYNREKDKVTLTIDVSVKDEKIEKFVSDPNKSNGTISMEIEKVSEFAREAFLSERKSETVHIGGFPWKILAKIEKKNDNEKWLDIYLLCDATKKDENWSCRCSTTFRIVSKKNGVSDFRREFDDYVFYNKDNNGWGFCFISFTELMDPEKGFYNKSEDKVTLAIDVTVKEAKTEDNS